MDIRKAVSSFLIATLLVSVSSARQKHKIVNHISIASQIEHRYAELAHDFETKNAKAFSETLTSDFVMKVTGRTFDKSQMIQDFKNEGSMMKVKSWVRKVSHVKMIGRTAVMNVVGYFAGTYQGTQKFALVARSVDTWVKTSKGWMWKSEIVKSMGSESNGMHLPAR